MCGSVAKILLSSSLLLTAGYSIAPAQGSNLVLDQFRIEFLRNRRTVSHLLTDFRATLDYLAKKDQNVSKYLKQVAGEKSKLVQKRIDEMPVWILDDSEIGEFASNASKSTGTDFRKLRERFEQTLYEHYKKKNPNAIQNLEEQWELVYRTIDEIEKETGKSEIVRQLFYWRVLRIEGLARFLRLPMVSKATGITEDEIKATKSEAEKQKKAIREEKIKSSRKIIATVLNELTSKQQKTFSRRMGIRLDALPKIIDRDAIGGIHFHLYSRYHKLKFCVKPYDYSQGHHFIPRRKTGILPSDKLVKSISNWKYSSRNRLRHHAVEVKSPTNEVPFAVKFEFQGAYQTNFVDTAAYMLSPRLFGKMESTDGEFKEAYSMFSPKKNELKTAYRDWTNEQIKKFNEAGYRASLATVKASSTDEICQIYSDWVAEVGEILLPEQAVFIYQRIVARNGLVSFLTRPDVATEMRISDSQKDKIVEVAGNAAKTIAPLEKKLTQQYYNAIVKSIPARKRQRLAKLLGVRENKLANQLMAVGSSIGHFRNASSPAYYWPRKKMLNALFDVNNDDPFRYNARYEKASKILGVPVKTVYPKYRKIK